MSRTKILVACVGLVLVGYVSWKLIKRWNRPRMADVGTTPSHTFDRALINGRGARALRDLRGLPTLVEFWAVG